MWIMTTKGFVSVVQHREFTTMLTVRGRRKEHVEQVLRDCGIDSKPLHIVDADYAWRYTISRAQFNQWLLLQSGDIKYPNFKDAVKAEQGETVYYKALTRVWALMRGITKAPKRRKADKFVADDFDINF